MKISNCENPSVVRNKYTGVLMQVPCGKCNSCILIQGSEWKQRLIEESNFWNYVLLFTLTFDNRYIPTATVISPSIDSYDKFLSFEEMTEYRLNMSYIQHNVDTDSNGNFLVYVSPINDKENEFIQVYSKTFGKDSFPVLSKNYARKFLKVLRRECKRLLPNSEFRIYLIGEYGASSFRPHYHGLFFTNDSEFCKEQFFSTSLANLVNISWSNMVFDNSEEYRFSLGITDVEKTDKSPRAIGYVSQYLNSITKLPQILRQKESAPFRIMSKERAIGFNEPPLTTLCTNFYSGNCKRVVYDSKTKEYRLELFPRAYCSRLFVEHRGFDVINVRYLGTWIVIASCCNSSKEFRNFLAYCGDILDLNLILDLTNDENLSKRINSLYYSLNKAFRLCLEFGCPPYLYGYYYSNFKSQVKLFKLKQFYELQESLVNDPSFDSRFLNCLYINDNYLRKHPVIPCNNLDFYGNIDNCPNHISDRLRNLKILLNNTKSKKRNDFLKNKELAKFKF